MPLSEHEQRLLDQIERALYAEDPKFASTVRGARLRRPSRRRRLQGIALFVLGIALLVLGVVLTLTAIRRGEGSDDSTDESGGAGGSSAKVRRSSFSQRMEERFRKRF